MKPNPYMIIFKISLCIMVRNCPTTQKQLCVLLAVATILLIWQAVMFFSIPFTLLINFVSYVLMSNVIMSCVLISKEVFP